MACSATRYGAYGHGGELAGGSDLWSARGRRLQGIIEPVERGVRSVSSQRSQRASKRARGRSRRRTGGGDLRCRRLKTTAGRALRGFWRRVRRWGASGRCGGASGASGRRGSGVERGVSGRRRRARSGELGGGKRGGGETRERGETVEGASWRRPSPSRGSRDQPSRQEVAGASAALATELLRALARRRRRGCPWWAGPAGPAGKWAQVRFFLFFFSYFLSVLFLLQLCSFNKNA